MQIGNTTLTPGISIPFTSPLMTIDEAADYLKCERYFISKIRKKGLIKSVILSRKKVMVFKDDLDEYIRLNTKEVVYG